MICCEEYPNVSKRRIGNNIPCFWPIKNLEDVIEAGVESTELIVTAPNGTEHEIGYEISGNIVKFTLLGEDNIHWGLGPYRATIWIDRDTEKQKVADSKYFVNLVARSDQEAPGENEITEETIDIVPSEIWDYLSGGGGCKVVNVADYIVGGKKHGENMPSDGDVYVFKYVTFRPAHWEDGMEYSAEGKAINYIPNHRIVDNKLVFKVQQDRETTLGLAYYVFTTSDGGSWALDEEFDGDDVPAWVKAAFGDDLHEKIGNLSELKTKEKKNLVKALNEVSAKEDCKVVNAADYIGKTEWMPADADVYTIKAANINEFSHSVIVKHDDDTCRIFCFHHNEADNDPFRYAVFKIKAVLNDGQTIPTFGWEYNAVYWKSNAPAWVLEAFDEDLRNKVDSMPIVVNVAEYLEGGKEMPLSADIFIMKDNGINFNVHSRMANYADEAHMIFCMQHVGETGLRYYVFNLSEEGTGWVFDKQYYASSVPGWVLEAFGENTSKKIAELNDTINDMKLTIKELQRRIQELEGN